MMLRVARFYDSLVVSQYMMLCVARFYGSLVVSHEVVCCHVLWLVSCRDGACVARIDGSSSPPQIAPPPFFYIFVMTMASAVYQGPTLIHL